MPRLDLDGRAALVTGAGRGIGLATARTLHERGARVALVDLAADVVEAGAEALGEGAIGIAADVTDPDAIGAAVERTVATFGGLDACVANAGIASAASTARAADPDVWERVIEVNLLGTYRTARAALPHLIERGGHLSLVSSIYAFFNGMLVSPYAVSKSAVEALGRAMRVELAERGVSVGVVYYGMIDTEMTRKGFREDPVAARLEAEHVPGFIRRRHSPESAARALADGIERRAPRVFFPAYLRWYSAFRGLANPLLDRRLVRDRKLQRSLRDADVEGRAAGHEIVGARDDDRPPRPGTRA
jgi:NAD(P)-dependent dehydrogenase (short-subunit alcohol dehydrogenase family)